MTRFLCWLKDRRKMLIRPRNHKLPTTGEAELKEARQALAESHQRADLEIERVTLQQQHWFEESLLQPQGRPRRRIDMEPTR